MPNMSEVKFSIVQIVSKNISSSGYKSPPPIERVLWIKQPPPTDFPIWYRPRPEMTMKSRSQTATDRWLDVDSHFQADVFEVDELFDCDEN